MPELAVCTFRAQGSRNEPVEMHPLASTSSELEFARMLRKMFEALAFFGSRVASLPGRRRRVEGRAD